MRYCVAACLGTCLLSLLSAAQAQPAASAVKTQVVILGTGNPNADPDRSGPAVAVVVNGNAYLVDCGPGVVRRAAAAAKAGTTALAVTKLKTVFITHLHSDHTLGYPDLIFSPWVLGRSVPLEAYGPTGLREMTSHIESAWKEDVSIRIHGLEQANPTGYKVNVHEIKPGVVYKDPNVTVTAFLVKHGTWKQAFGYRFQTPDRTIVISGDTAPSDSVVEACHGCDLLLHEVYSPGSEQTQAPHWKAYFASFHTSPEELAALATRARPRLLVLYHQVFHGASDQELLDAVRKNYAGKVVSAHDLDLY